MQWGLEEETGEYISFCSPAASKSQARPVDKLFFFFPSPLFVVPYRSDEGVMKRKGKNFTLLSVVARHASSA